MTSAHRARLLAGAACLASAAPAAAQAPVNGRIAYTALSTPTAADGDIFTMNGDGSDKQPAVTDPLYDAQTDWSPDGTQSSQPGWFPDMTGIVYRRTNAPGTTRSDIW